jgi:hypothetical protein
MVGEVKGSLGALRDFGERWYLEWIFGADTYFGFLERIPILG